jgi:hypothetical protein
LSLAVGIVVRVVGHQETLSAIERHLDRQGLQVEYDKLMLIHSYNRFENTYGVHQGPWLQSLSLAFESFLSFVQPIRVLDAPAPRLAS